MDKTPAFAVPITLTSGRIHFNHSNSTIRCEPCNPQIFRLVPFKKPVPSISCKTEPPLGRDENNSDTKKLGTLHISRRQALQLVNALLGVMTFTLLVKMKEQFRLLSPNAVFSMLGLTKFPVRTNAAIASPTPTLQQSADQLAAARNHIRHVESQPPFQCPDFPKRADWINTQPLSLETNLSGKLVLLDFFTYCCINCQHVLPKLAALEAKYGTDGSGGFVVVGVHSAKFSAERDTTNVAAAVDRYDVKHPVINDSSMELWNALGISSWPTLALIAPSGRLLALWSGERQEDDIDAMVAAALEHYTDTIDHRPLPAAPKQAALFGQRSQSPLRYPGKISLSGDGKYMFVADSGNNRILQIDFATGVATRVFGDGEEGLKDSTEGAKARFHTPQGLAYHDGILYVADTESHAVRAIDLDKGSVSTIGGDNEQGFDYQGGKIGQNQQMSSPWDIEVVNNWIYVAMAGTHQIWRTRVPSHAGGYGPWQVFSGTGRELEKNSRMGRTASWAQPSHLSATPGGLMFVADSESSSVRAIDLSTDSYPTRTVAGGDGLLAENLFAFGDKEGRGSKAKFQHPLAVCFDPVGDRLFVADSYNHRIKIIDSTGLASDFCGAGNSGFQDGVANKAKFWEPAGLAISSDGKTLYVADTNNFAIRAINTSTREVSTFPIRESREVASTILAKPLIPYRKRAVIIAVHDVKPASKLSFRINLPEKSHFTDGTISRYQVNVKHEPSDSQIDIVDSGTIVRSGGAGEFSIDLSKAQSLSKAGQIEIEAVTYYCTEVDGVCRVEPNVFTIGLSEQGTTGSVTHTIATRKSLAKSGLT